MKHPPDAARKNQLLSETKEEEDAHQFFFTTGWIERFAQIKSPQSATGYAGDWRSSGAPRRSTMMKDRSGCGGRDYVLHAKKSCAIWKSL